MLEKLIALVCLWTIAECWKLSVNQHHVTTGLSKNLTIKCDLGVNEDKTSPIITNLYRIRIMKFNKENEWDTVASITAMDSFVKSSLNDATVTGKLAEPNLTFIEIHFDVASDQAIGQFLCEVDGFDVRMNVKLVTTNPILIRQQSISTDELLENFIELKTKQRSDLKQLNDAITSLDTKFGAMLKTVSDIADHMDKSEAQRQKHQVELEQQIKHELSTVIANFTDRFGDVSSKYAKTAANENIEISKLGKLMDMFIDKFQGVGDWPTGRYSILKPDTGCPHTFTISTFQFSSQQVATRPGNQNKDHGSDILNLSGNVFQNIDDRHYINIEMCSKLSDPKVLKPTYFPKGSYCINMYSPDKRYDDSRCPNGMKPGYKQFGRFPNGKKVDKVVNIPIVSIYNSPTYTDVFFCCRNDGPVTDPISLPRHEPFILYRYGGVCQQVEGMNMSNQWLYFDTTTKYGRNSNRGPTSDGYANNNGARIDFCYYTPRH